MNIFTFHVCDVCRLLDGNIEERPCYYCVICRAWICRSDEFNHDRRARAMIRQRQIDDDLLD